MYVYLLLVTRLLSDPIFCLIVAVKLRHPTPRRKTASAYESRSSMYGAQDDMVAQAAQLRADFMARNGQTEWLDVQQNTRVEELERRGLGLSAPLSPATQAIWIVLIQ